MPQPLQLEPRHVQLMRELDRYRLLSEGMMRRLGTAGRDRQRISQAARFLVLKKLAARTEATIFAGKRRVPQLYWLTPKGAATLNALDELSGEAAAIGAERRFGHMNEVMHRVGLVDMHLAVRAWCETVEVELERFTLDFEPGSPGRHKATEIKGDGYRFTPDALAWLRPAGDEGSRLLVVELERGGEAGDLYPFFKHKLPHLRALAAGRTVERHFLERDYPLGARARFLIVFGSHVIRRGVPVPLHLDALSRWPDPADPVWDRFVIKSQDELAANFNEGWHQPGDRPARHLFEVAA